MRVYNGQAALITMQNNGECFDVDVGRTRNEMLTNVNSEGLENLSDDSGNDNTAAGKTYIAIAISQLCTMRQI